MSNTSIRERKLSGLCPLWKKPDKDSLFTADRGALFYCRRHFLPACCFPPCLIFDQVSDHAAWFLPRAKTGGTSRAATSQYPSREAFAHGSYVYLIPQFFLPTTLPTSTLSGRFPWQQEAWKTELHVTRFTFTLNMLPSLGVGDLDLDPWRLCPLSGGRYILRFSAPAASQSYSLCAYMEQRNMVSESS